jgi:hypothetical protein
MSEASIGKPSWDCQLRRVNRDSIMATMICAATSLGLIAKGMAA